MKAKHLMLIVIYLCSFSSFLKSQNLEKSLHSDSIDVLHYDINLNIDNTGNQSISGFTVLKIVPKVNNLNLYILDLLQLEIDSVKSDTFGIMSFSYNDTLLKISSSTSLMTTDTINIEVYYHGNPVIDPSGWGGFYFSGNYAFNLGVGFADNPHCYGRVWFPCLDDFIDRAKYDYRITVPSGNTAVCGGLLIGNQFNDDSTNVTFHWRMNTPIPTYLASVAVGNYSSVNFNYNGITGNIPVNIYSNPADTIDAVHSFLNLNNALSIFENRFGPYLWERVGYVSVPFTGGAMEHATNVAYPSYAIDGTLNGENLYVHELSHSWFGNLVTCHSAEDMWLNEGMASFSVFVFLENQYSQKKAKDLIRETHRDNIQYLPYEDGNIAIYGIPSSQTYCNTVYYKGALITHTLRGYLGDSIFFHAIRNYLQSFKFSDVSTAQFRDFLTSYSGTDMTDFFDAWIYSPGYLHFSVDSTLIVQNGDGFDVTVNVRQKLRDRSNYANSNRLEITFFDENLNRVSKSIEFSGQTGHQTFSLDFSPVLVIPDFNEKIADATTDYYKLLTNPGTFDFPETFFTAYVTDITDTTFLLAERNWLAPDSFKVPHPGYILSNSGYWTIYSYFTPGFKSNGRFSYSRNTSGDDGYLDYTWLNDSISDDSLVLFFRHNVAEDWQLVEFVRQGNFYHGKLVTDSLMPGEYAIGAKYHQSTEAIREKYPKQNSIKVIPNPATGNFLIDFVGINCDNLKIFDSSGKARLNKNISTSVHSMILNAAQFNNGIFYLKLEKSGNQVAETKFIVQ